MTLNPPNYQQELDEHNNVEEEEDADDVSEDLTLAPRFPPPTSTTTTTTIKNNNAGRDDDDEDDKDSPRLSPFDFNLSSIINGQGQGQHNVSPDSEKNVLDMLFV